MWKYKLTFITVGIAAHQPSSFHEISEEFDQITANYTKTLLKNRKATDVQINTAFARLGAGEMSGIIWIDCESAYYKNVAILKFAKEHDNT